MRIVFRYVLWLLLFPLGLHAQTKLPAKCPADLRLTLEHGGGMVYYSSKLYLAKDSCFFQQNNHGTETTQTFQLSEKEFETLYKSLRTHKFDKIKTEQAKGTVHDRGGKTMRIDWDKGQKSLSVTDKHNTFVQKSWQEAWLALQNDINELLKNKIEIDKH